MGFQIRKAKRDDFNNFKELREEDILEYSKVIKEKIKIPSDKELTKEFLGLMSSKKNIILFVCDEQNKTRGYLIGSIFNNIWQKSAYIDDLFIKKSYKRKGLGKLLISEFIRYVKKNKIKKCKLQVNVKNKKAISLYKNLGFKLYSYEMDLKL